MAICHFLVLILWITKMTVRSKKERYIDSVNRNIEQCLFNLNRYQPQLWSNWITEYLDIKKKND